MAWLTVADTFLLAKENLSTDKKNALEPKIDEVWPSKRRLLIMIILLFVIFWPKLKFYNPIIEFIAKYSY